MISSNNNGSVLNRSVLVLNTNYAPLDICTARRAICLFFNEKVEILESYTESVHSPTTTLSLPSIVKLRNFVKYHKLDVILTRRNILVRDNHQCQYCSFKKGPLTIDHVIPRFQSGGLTWENIVTACIPCNHRKAGRTPEQAGMMLMKKPKPPYPSPYYVLYGRVILDEWRKFIFWTID